MPLKSRVRRGGVQHHRRKNTNAVGHAHQVDTDHPFPVLQTVFPNEATRAHTGVVKNEVRRTKTRQCGGAQRLHLVRLGHIYAHTKHLRTHSFHFSHRAIQCVLLYVGQYQIHAELGTDPRAFQAKAGTGTGEYCRLIAKVRNHAKVLSVKLKIYTATARST